MRLFIFSDGWGYTHGGINAFNYEFCKALIARITESDSKERIDAELIIITNGFSDEERIELHLNDKIKIINLTPDKCCDFDTVKKLLISHNQEFSEDTFFIGHDIITGEIAEKCAKHFKGKSVIFHHMAYAQYYNLISNDENAIKNKKDRQNKILVDADLVLGIGEKLEESAKTIVANNGGKSLVGQMLPGFDQPSQVAQRASEQFRVFFSGRIEYSSNGDNNIIKQYDCVVKAFSQLVADGSLPASSKLYLCGMENPDETLKHFKDLTVSITDKIVSIEAFKYLDHNHLMEILRNSSVAIMPSFEEGFGLVGLEAISVNIPIIISKNSGLYKLIKYNNKTNLIQEIEISGSDSDVNILKGLILKVKNAETDYRNWARELGEYLAEKYSWGEIIERFVKALTYSKYYKINDDEFQKGLIELFFDM